MKLQFITFVVNFLDKKANLSSFAILEELFQSANILTQREERYSAAILYYLSNSDSIYIEESVIQMASLKWLADSLTLANLFTSKEVYLPTSDLGTGKKVLFSSSAFGKN